MVIARDGLRTHLGTHCDGRNDSDCDQHQDSKQLLHHQLYAHSHQTRLTNSLIFHDPRKTAQQPPLLFLLLFFLTFFDLRDFLR